MNKYVLGGVALLSGSLLFAGCTDINSANQKEASQVSQQQQVYVDSQPVPAFDWSLERHLMIELYKARNNAVATYSYVRNLQGQVIFSCSSIGFPIPANTELTNPSIVTNGGSQSETGSGNVTLPQAEPNGMYSSPSSAGTYIFCLNQDGTVSPTYFEANVEAHTQKLDATGMTTTGESTLKIDTKK